MATSSASPLAHKTTLQQIADLTSSRDEADDASSVGANNCAVAPAGGAANGYSGGVVLVPDGIASIKYDASDNVFDADSSDSKNLNLVHPEGFEPWTPTPNDFLHSNKSLQSVESASGGENNTSEGQDGFSVKTGILR